jgi:hypothetical protein
LKFGVLQHEFAELELKQKKLSLSKKWILEANRNNYIDFVKVTLKLHSKKQNNRDALVLF